MTNQKQLDLSKPCVTEPGGVWVKLCERIGEATDNAYYMFCATYNGLRCSWWVNKFGEPAIGCFPRVVNAPDPPPETFNLDKALRMKWCECEHEGAIWKISCLHTPPLRPDLIGGYDGMLVYYWDHAGKPVEIANTSGYSHAHLGRLVNSHLPEPEYREYFVVVRENGGLHSYNMKEAAVIIEHSLKKDGNLYGTATVRVLKESEVV